MFLGYQNNIIVFAANTKEELENLQYMPFTNIVETDEKYVLENGSYVKQDEEYFHNKIEDLKKSKHYENTQKAKQAIENGYVKFNGAEFETNTQTVSDLIATMLIMQSNGISAYGWLSKDDIKVDLTLENISFLGGLIADFKNMVWGEKYLYFKTLIEKAETVEDLENIVIDYNIQEEKEVNNDNL